MQLEGPINTATAGILIISRVSKSMYRMGPAAQNMKFKLTPLAMRLCVTYYENINKKYNKRNIIIKTIKVDMVVITRGEKATRFISCYC